MASSSTPDVTQLLLAWRNGETQALAQLAPMVSRELHRLAHRYMDREHPGHVLQTTALVNEAYLRLIDAQQLNWQNRAHFFAISAKLMRRVLVEMARSDRAEKRGGWSHCAVFRASG
jgi:RNA polymerase sigma factor (TIGR02999 family)